MGAEPPGAGVDRAENVWAGGLRAVGVVRGLLGWEGVSCSPGEEIRQQMRLRAETAGVPLAKPL